MIHRMPISDMGEPGKPLWKQPSIREIAEIAGVGPATVDRVLNNRTHVSERARKRVFEALNKLTRERINGQERLEISLFCVSGESFNAEIAEAERQVNGSFPGVEIHGSYIATRSASPEKLRKEIETKGQKSDGVILIANEHPEYNRAVKTLRHNQIPVACLTTDLPNSMRSVYVGNDQVSAGSTVAYLIGKCLSARPQRILLVMSVPFRSQQERELGLRRVFRTDFPYLHIDEHVITDDDPEHTVGLISSYLESNEPPAAIYNTAGGNRGVALALQSFGLEKKILFIGHELTEHTRTLLEKGIMDFVISHDYVNEMRTAVRCIRNLLNGVTPEETSSQVLVHTRFNCGL